MEVIEPFWDLLRFYKSEEILEKKLDPITYPPFH